MSQDKKRGIGRTLRGVVSSDKMDKTITVTVTNTVRHAAYKKFMKRSKKYHAHDENNQCKLGDVVVIKESAPYSKTKKWRLAKVVETRKL
ncbi:MAG: 30S ribosomal protein S17 [Myxococcales bacterium]|nr:30S ribosomal protein S17 [Myxococcales bacterium]USN50899.1 MAG: 30S ribosomal protein S17 [Myxococcales bacterium]